MINPPPLHFIGVRSVTTALSSVLETKKYKQKEIRNAK